MQLSFLITLATASLVLSAPVHKRDDDDGPVVVHLTTTVKNLRTNFLTVAAATDVQTQLIVSTSTETFTRYTATVTSTVFGTPVTYVTVATTPFVSKAPTPQSTSPATTDDSPSPQSTSPATTADSPAPQSSSATTEQVTTSSQTTAPAVSSQSTTPAVATSETPSSSDEKTTTTHTTTTSTTPSSSSTASSQAPSTKASPVSTPTPTSAPTPTSSEDGPTITNLASIPTAVGQWVITNIFTSTASGNVCVVNYDYYDINDAEVDTVTSTSTIYSTVTQA